MPIIIATIYIILGIATYIAIYYLRYERLKHKDNWYLSELFLYCLFCWPVALGFIILDR